MSRRCVVCTLPVADHKPALLAAKGYAPHPFDPGERRSGKERRAPGEERRRVA